MSEKPKTLRSDPPFRTWMQPPPNIPPSIGPSIGCEHGAHIPQDKRNLHPLPFGVQPHEYHHSSGPGDVTRVVPSYPPPVTAHHSNINTSLQQHPLTPLPASQPSTTNVYQAHIPPPPNFSKPPPDFSRPPPSFPPIPPNFSKPPPLIAYDVGNIPLSHENRAIPQSHQSSSSLTTKNSSPPWCRDPPQLDELQTVQQALEDSVSCSMVQAVFAEDSSGGFFKDNTVKTLEDDQKWLREFEKRLKNQQAPPPPAKTMSRERTLKLMDIKKMVTESQMLANSLRQMEEEMNQVRNTADDCVWKNLVQQAEEIKSKLKEVIISFQDEHFIWNVKKLINQRRMKRKRMKRRRKEIRLEEEEVKKARQEEEEKVDAWREKLEVEAEEKRREKAIKAEADSILGEVQQKQNDTLRMQQLLESLITLRLTRINKGAAHGYISASQSDQRFSSTIKGIGDVVRSQMKEYELEEQTLRVMMEESASHQCSLAGKEENAIIRHQTMIKKILFGDYAPLDVATTETFTSADRSLDSLVNRRCDWDQYLTDDDNPLASSIPLHWVTPPSHPTPPWAEFQIQ